MVTLRFLLFFGYIFKFGVFNMVEIFFPAIASGAVLLLIRIEPPALLRAPVAAPAKQAHHKAVDHVDKYCGKYPA